MLNRILVASYTTSVYTLEFDSSAASLSVLSAAEAGFHPSWIEFHPSDRSLVFAALEQTDGKIVLLKLDESGSGTKLAETPSMGADPCAVLATHDELIVANYSSGSISVTPIAPTAPYFLPGAVVTQLFGRGPNDQRQQGPHAHHVVLDAQRAELLVADLGADRLCRFTKQDGGWTLQAYVPYERGSGPRHVAIFDGALYTLLELSSSLAKHRFHALPAAPTLIATKPTMFNPPAPPHDMLAAELLIPKPNGTFPAPYAYVSNRNDPSDAGDTIAIFSIAGDDLELVAEVHTGLKHLRGMAFGGADDKWLVAGGVNGGGVKVFERIQGGRLLKEVAANGSVASPTGFLWV